MSKQRLKLHVWDELSNGGSESHALVWQEWPWAPHYKSLDWPPVLGTAYDSELQVVCVPVRQSD